VPIVPVGARLALSGADSNHSSSRSAQLIVIILMRSAWSAGGILRNRRPACRACSAPVIPGDPGSGGVMESIGRTKPATRAIAALHRGQVSASRAEKREICRASSPASRPRRRERPSGNGVNEVRHDRNSRPWSRRRRSRMISGWRSEQT
jgi:hypothetical protein